MVAKATDERSTPQDLFDYANAKYGPFDLDVCATAENAKCPRYYTIADDGLSKQWASRNWMNCPYSRGEQIRWVRRAVHCTEFGLMTCGLLPADTSTALWHDHIWDARTGRPYAGVEVEFLRGRKKFGGAKAGAKFGSALVVFR